MEEFTNFEELDLEKMSGEALDSFCDRYIEDAMRVINTGIYFKKLDDDMIRLALAIIVGLYFKRLTDTNQVQDRVIN